MLILSKIFPHFLCPGKGNQHREIITRIGLWNGSHPAPSGNIPIFQRKLQDDLDEVNNKWRTVKENLEKFEDDTKEKLEDEKRKVRTYVHRCFSQ